MTGSLRVMVKVRGLVRVGGRVRDMGVRHTGEG